MAETEVRDTELEDRPMEEVATELEDETEDEAEVLSVEETEAELCVELVERLAVELLVALEEPAVDRLPPVKPVDDVADREDALVDRPTDEGPLEEPIPTDELEAAELETEDLEVLELEALEPCFVDARLEEEGPDEVRVPELVEAADCAPLEAPPLLRAADWPLEAAADDAELAPITALPLTAALEVAPLDAAAEAEDPATAELLPADRLELGAPLLALAAAPVVEPPRGEEHAAMATSPERTHPAPRISQRYRTEACLHQALFDGPQG